MFFKNKKVLLVGLGILGGGVGTANYLIESGADLTITDLKNKKDLHRSIKKIKSKKITYRLGRHDEKDFKKADIIVFNQSVPFGSHWVKFAIKLQKPIESDLTIFSDSLKRNKGEYIGITGTRGKTTTSNWLAHFLPEATMGGNMPEKGLLCLDRGPSSTCRGRSSVPQLFVLELSSFQLEYSNPKTLAPKIAIITNLYVDHVNYHGTLKKYFEAKFKIFKNQTKNDYLILNRDNKNTSLILKEKPKAKIYFFSLSSLPKNQNGLFATDDQIIFQEDGKQKLICELKKDFSGHLRSNLLPAMLGAHLEEGSRTSRIPRSPTSWESICKRIHGLPEVPMRQEIILKNKNVTVINDSAATSPEATIAAIERFAKGEPFGKPLILICGGTDKQLEFKDLAKKINKYIKPENHFLLEGSATNKLIRQLKFKKVRTFKTLKDIVQVLPKEGTIVFSPAAASFEKFKNEFDRGEQFNKLIKGKFGGKIGGR